MKYEKWPPAHLMINCESTWPGLTENMECLIVKSCTTFINLKVGVLLYHGVSLRFVSLLALWTCWATFQTKNNVRSSHASSALTLVLHRSHNMHATNRHLHGSGERNGAQRRTKVSFSITMMQALELLWLAKTHVSRRSDVEQWKIKPVAIAIIKFCLFEGIS